MNTGDDSGMELEYIILQKRLFQEQKDMLKKTVEQDHFLIIMNTLYT